MVHGWVSCSQPERSYAIHDLSKRGAARPSFLFHYDVCSSIVAVEHVPNTSFAHTRVIFEGRHSFIPIHVAPRRPCRLIRMRGLHLKIHSSRDAQQVWISFLRGAYTVDHNALAPQSYVQACHPSGQRRVCFDHACQTIGNRPPLYSAGPVIRKQDFQIARRFLKTDDFPGGGQALPCIAGGRLMWAISAAPVQ